MSEGLVSITVEDSAFREHLAHLQLRLGDMTRPMSEIGAALETRVAARFEGQSDPRGAPWTPWAASTRRSYPANANGRLLDRYGDMLASLSWQADSSSVRVGFGQPYATYHEWGTRRMPRRGLLFEDPDAGSLTSEDEHFVTAVLDRWLEAS